MVRFGCRAGLTGLFVLAWLAGCNNEDAATPDASRPGAGGGAPSFAALEQAVGRVLVVGESAKVPLFEREYRGLAERAKDGTDLVRCELASSAGGFVVSIEAAQEGSSTLQFAASWFRPSLGPARFDVTPSDTDENAVRVRLGDGNASSYYEYELDGTGDPVTLCSAGFTTFDRGKVVGTIACRRLLATSSSLDAIAQGGETGMGPATASVTVDFSCPFHTLAGPGGDGSAGGGSTRGEGGGGGRAGSTAGASSTGGTSDTMGGSGSAVQKHCVGVTTPCSLRDSVSCELSNGCTLDESCTGFPASCYGQLGVYSCTAIQGCFWASSSQTCTGSAWSCSTFAGSLSCSDQPGCNWHSDCSGVAPLCSTLSELTCELESGCRWE